MSQCPLAIQDFFFFQKVIMTEKGDNLLSLEVPGLAENRPSVLKGDRIYVRVYASSNNPEPEKKEYEGIVHEVENTRILVGFAKDLRKRWKPLEISDAMIIRQVAICKLYLSQAKIITALILVILHGQ